MQSTHTKPNSDLVVWHITDSALPTGAFAHSAGMETFIQDGEIDDPESFSVWLRDYLYQATFGEALSARFAARLGAKDLPLEEAAEQLHELDALTHATQTPKQLRVSMNSMGRRMSKVARIVDPENALVEEYDGGLKERRYKGNPGIAAGLLLGAAGVDEHTAVRAYLMQMATSMVQNAIRAIPLGQDAGQRILVEIYPYIDAFAEVTLKHDWHDLGVTAPRLEQAQMAHEHLRSRMFMS
ncbi:urease accessory protein [Corynebacterium appendicis CIP 107643]|uniref:Urease accessory protein UreF n=1 Tax=Corynebacterium appendicis CIP 107643 TaxID=1161099 RepID=A0A1N7JXJ1_9CORY|nr:urease accessory UreF family protein [Corynebacterium appendicis]WJY60584.1 Urease accessory protein UreF [Corynebacterium appendicis CIP 107643]SIS54048.1 urease accessory protein [Corynebacterium appendicis CIP 107643]